jgi:hypothetical protein
MEITEKTLAMDIAFIGFPSGTPDESGRPVFVAEDDRIMNHFSRLGGTVQLLKVIAGSEHMEAHILPWHLGPKGWMAVPPGNSWEEEVYWEDFQLLYISSSVAAAPAEYGNFVKEIIADAAQFGVFTVADLRGSAGQVPWAGKTDIAWTQGALAENVSVRHSQILFSLEADRVSFVTPAGPSSLCDALRYAGICAIFFDAFA